MTDKGYNTSLSRLAQRLQNDPRFMSYVLTAYQRQEGLDTEGLAQELGAPPGLLRRLTLCKRPDSNSPQFAEQVREIADYTLTDEAQLANILRQVDSLEKLAQLDATPVEPEVASQTALPLSGFLAVARDRDETEEPEERQESLSKEPPGAED